MTEESPNRAGLARDVFISHASQDTVMEPPPGGTAIGNSYRLNCRPKGNARTYHIAFWIDYRSSA